MRNAVLLIFNICTPTALYFTMTCLTSIGFGNVAAETDIEKVNNLSVINNETKTRSKQRQPIGIVWPVGR